MYPSVQATIDKTAREGVIHRNKASRLKARLAKEIA
jgi:ribosomal protein S20